LTSDQENVNLGQCGKADQVGDSVDRDHTLEERMVVARLAQSWNTKNNIGLVFVTLTCHTDFKKGQTRT
jgi:hypothetical protein